MMRKVFIAAAVVLLLALPGCALLGGGIVKKYDPTTVGAIDKTVAYEQESFALLSADLDKIGSAATPAEAATAADQARKNAVVRRDAELARLGGWRLYESSKQGAPPYVPPAPAGGGK